jgi:hypothetical protein
LGTGTKVTPRRGPLGYRSNKLNDNERERLLFLRAKGTSILELSRMFFISTRQVRSILEGK